MALVFVYGVAEYSSTIGTDSYALDGALPNSFRLAEKMADGDAGFFQITNEAESEYIRGTFSAPNLLHRTEVISSSNGGQPVSWLQGGRRTIRMIGPQGATENLFATGNTTGAASSTIRELTAPQSISGAGGVSVGYDSNGGLVISGGAATISSVSSAVSGGGIVWSHYEVIAPPGGSVILGTTTQGSVMLFAPMSFLGGTLTFDQVNLFVSKSGNVGSVQMGTVTNSSNSTVASCGWVGTLSLIKYSQVNATSFASEAVATVSWGHTVRMTLSRSNSSLWAGGSVGFGTITHSWEWNVGSGVASTSTGSAIGSSRQTGTAAFVMNQGSTQMYGSQRFDVPWASSFTAGQYLVGMIGSSSSFADTATWFTFTAPHWANIYYMNFLAPGGFGSGPGDNAQTYALLRGWGTATAVGGTYPASVNWQALAAGTKITAPHMAFALFGTN